MLTIPNLPTQDRYVDALTLGPVPTTRQIKYVVANRAVLMRVWPKLKSGTIPAQTDELLVTPETNVITDAIGVQFRSALPGVPAQVIAQLLEPGDPTFGSGTPFSATISGSGGISPGVSSVQVQVDGALIGTEPILDLLTGAGATLLGTDDPANTRTLVTVSGYAKLLGEVVLAAPAASISFNAISQAYRHLELVTVARSDVAAQAANAMLRVNADAAANYHDEGVFGAAATAGAYDDILATSAVCTVIAGNTATANRAGYGRVLLPYYSAPVWEKTFHGDGALFVDDAGFFRVSTLSGHWKNVAAITALSVISSPGNFMTGSRFALYGIV